MSTAPSSSAQRPDSHPSDARPAIPQQASSAEEASLPAPVQTGVRVPRLAQPEEERRTLRYMFRAIRLSPEAFAQRHSALRVLMVVVLAVVFSFIAISSQQDITATTGEEPWLPTTFSWIALGLALAATVSANWVKSQPLRAVIMSQGLAFASLGLLHLSQGQTEFHFVAYLVVALVGLYQEILAFSLAIATIVLHNFIAAGLDPAAVFSSPSALDHPWFYAALHNSFLLISATAQVAYWRYIFENEKMLHKSLTEMGRLALAVQHTDNAIAVLSPDGVVEWVNDSFARMNDQRCDQAIGRHRLGMLRANPENVDWLANRLKSSAEAFDAEFLVEGEDDQQYWLDIQVQPIRENGELTGWITIERDVTARRDAQDRLRATTRRAELLASALDSEKSLLSNVINAIPHVVYWKDPNGKYAGINDAFLGVHGAADASLLLGRVDHEVDPSNALFLAFRDLEAEVRVTRNTIVDRNVSFIAPDGTKRSYLLGVSPRMDGRGVIAGLIGVAADVTRIAELERQLAQASRLESIGQLAAGIAHEINTPVQFVSDNTRFVADSFEEISTTLRLVSKCVTKDLQASLAQLLTEDEIAELNGVDIDLITSEMPAALQESLDGLERVTQIVRAMKEFSHPGDGRSEADLNQALESTMQVSRNEWKYLADIELDLDENAGTVPSFEGELKQVFLNIIVNAAQAIESRNKKTGTLEKGLITITTKRHADDFEIRFHDTGSGMPPEVLARIFDPFFTTKEVGKGTGQGLSLAHSCVVIKHGGTLEAESVEGEGTTMILRLPLKVAVEESGAEVGAL